jgi:hypothetical protein
MQHIISSAKVRVTVGGLSFEVSQEKAQQLIHQLQSMGAIAVGESFPAMNSALHYNGQQLING